MSAARGFLRKTTCTGSTGVVEMRSLSRILGLCAAGMLSTSAMAALTSINEGFESPSFSVGALNGQPASSPASDQWTAGTTTPATVNIATANPNGGTQHVRLFPNAAAGTFSGLGSPIISIPTSTSTVTKFDLAVNGADPVDGPSEYDILLQDRAHSGIVVEMRLSFTGEIIVVDNGTPVTTSGTWTFGSVGGNTAPYQTFEIDTFSSANSITYKRNGTTFYTSTLPSGGGTTVDQFVLVSDNFGDPSSLHADIDNVSLIPLVPEPAMAGLISAGVLILGRRRK